MAYTTDMVLGEFESAAGAIGGTGDSRSGPARAAAFWTDFWADLRASRRSWVAGRREVVRSIRRVARGGRRRR